MRHQAWSHKSCALKYDSSPIFLIWDYVAPQCCSTGVTNCDTISSPDLCLNPKNYEPDTKMLNFTCSYYKRYLEYSADIKSDDGRAGPWTASTCRQSSRIFDGYTVSPSNIFLFHLAMSLRKFLSFRIASRRGK